MQFSHLEVEEATYAPETKSLIGLLIENATFLWREWPKEMQANLIGQQQARNFTLAGICPHCLRNSAFLLVTNVHTPSGHQWVAGLQCQGCMEYILGIVQYNVNSNTLTCIHHYPVGKPDDRVDEEIPDHIKSDFKEALRCLWVNAYNAAAEMCRRAVEASCLDLGAPPKKVLDDMIDWLEKQRKITPFLKEVAHKIRLGGNRGAHPEAQNDQQIAPAAAPAELGIVAADNSASVTTIEKEHAEAIVKFTREFFHHVYVVPKQLDKYDFSKPKNPSKLN